MSQSFVQKNKEAFYPLDIRQLSWQHYNECLHNMQSFTLGRDIHSIDEIWLLQHPPTYTLGLNGKEEHILDADDIPVIRCDRGGQVTYHGPGQLIVYFLIDIDRRGWGVKYLVHLIEQIIIDLLATYSIDVQRKEGAPGIYVGADKIAALGLRVKKGCTYHGVSLNIDMDMSPFEYINPCGYEGLKCVQMKDIISDIDFSEVRRRIRTVIIDKFV
ncbi:MAG: lipoyl(octanoyl) transferase LipB [Thiohalomonadales bacterium]